MSARLRNVVSDFNRLNRSPFGSGSLRKTTLLAKLHRAFVCHVAPTKVADYIRKRPHIINRAWTLCALLLHSSNDN